MNTHIKKKSDILDLIANLATRYRLGMSRIEGSYKDLDELLRLIVSENLTDSLTCIAKEIENCIRCKLSADFKKNILGQGIAPARFIFINKAPGFYEEKYMVPLAGTEAQLFEHMLTAVQLKYVDIYLTNIIKCRTPSDRNPLPIEIAACWPFLEAQIQAVSPESICVLGIATTQALLNHANINYDIKDIYGKWIFFLGIPLLTIFHPSFLLSNPSYKSEAYRIIKMLVKGKRFLKY